MINEPNKLYEVLKQDATSRVAKSLDIIHQVCIEQAERGSHDFTIATIGKLSEAAHGPKAQTIRNKTGERYKELIDSWAKFKAPLKVTPSKIKEKYSWVNDITDSRIKWLVLDLIAQESRLTGQLQLAKEQSNIHIDLRPATKNKSVGGLTQQYLVKSELLSSERAALSHSIDQIELAKKGWEIEKNGRVRDENGNEIFKVGFITAVEKMLFV